MGDFLRSIIKWILLVLVVVFVVWLVIHLATKNEAKKVNPKEKVEIKEQEPVTIEDPIQPTREEDRVLVIDAVDTATTPGVTAWIGVLIVSAGSVYILKTKKQME